MGTAMNEQQLSKLWEATRILLALRGEMSQATETGRKIDDLACLAQYLAQHQDAVRRGDHPRTIDRNREDWSVRVQRMER